MSVNYVILLPCQVNWGPFGLKVGDVEVKLKRHHQVWSEISFEGTLGLFGQNTKLKATRTLDEFKLGKKLIIKFSKGAPPLIQLGPVSMEGEVKANAILSLLKEGGEYDTIPLILEHKGEKFLVDRQDNGKLIKGLQLKIGGLSLSGLFVKEYKFL